MCRDSVIKNKLFNFHFILIYFRNRLLFYCFIYEAQPNFMF